MQLNLSVRLCVVAAHAESSPAESVTGASGKATTGIWSMGSKSESVDSLAASNNNESCEPVSAAGGTNAFIGILWIQTDRQTDRQADRQTDKMDRQTRQKKEESHCSWTIHFLSSCRLAWRPLIVSKN